MKWRRSRTANSIKEFQASVEIEIVLFAILVDRNSVDVFHHKKWNAVVGRARVEQAGNIRMIQPGLDLSFAFEVAAEPHCKFD